MSAYDELTSQLTQESLDGFRKKLISPRGMIMSGKLCEYMDLSSRVRNYSFFDLDEANDDEPESSMQVNKIFIRKNASKTQNSGFVFDAEGTQKIIQKVINSSDLKILDLKDNFLFADERKKELWDGISENRKKNLIFKNIYKMKKDTDMQYRIHGSRLHYLVIGKITFTKDSGSKTEHLAFPMFMFECSETREKECAVSVDQAGFMNFTIDDPKYFNGALKEWDGYDENEVVMNNSLPIKLNSLKEYAKKINLPSITDIEFDPQYSMIGVITGFETEYLDKAWSNILK